MRNFKWMASVFGVVIITSITILIVFDKFFPSNDVKISESTQNIIMYGINWVVPLAGLRN
jgi:hypothetical protein